MSAVVKNQDDTFTVTLSNKEIKTLERWAVDQGRTKAKQLESMIEQAIRDKSRDYYTDPVVPELQDRYRNASPAVQNQVDTLLGS